MSFPDGFKWGVASAAYQVEGAATEGGRGPSVWDAFSRRPGAVYEGHTGDIACNQYHRYPEDVRLIADLGASAYRLSMAWPRVMPEGTGEVNEAGLAYYDRLVDTLLHHGVEPWITLYHWDMPLALFHRGGWLHPDSPKWFGDYAAVVAERLGDRVQHWMTINEPQVFLNHGHVEGEHAPGMKYSRPDALLATHHVLMAHGMATNALREHAPKKAVVGWAPVGVCAVPASEDPRDIEAARLATLGVFDQRGWAFNNSWYSDPVVFGRYPEDGLRAFGVDVPDIRSGDLEIIRQPLDFYGVNIYQAHQVTMGADGQPETVTRPRGWPTTMHHWPVTPEALYWGPKFIAEKYQLPMYITENGLASMDWVHADGKVHDAARVDFLTRYLAALRRAVSEGVDVRGYFQWSIMDNYEWAQGYRMRFGLVYVDYQTLERIPKDSYHWYKEVVASNGGVIPRTFEPLR
ncbi:MAG: GH1 family beta-glucosidase [Planctomycetota bacterium]